jgi:membrane-bound ClpP family serine protease
MLTKFKPSAILLLVGLILLILGVFAKSSQYSFSGTLMIMSAISFIVALIFAIIRLMDRK